MYATTITYMGTQKRVLYNKLLFIIVFTSNLLPGNRCEEDEKRGDEVVTSAETCSIQVVTIAESFTVDE